MGRVVSKSAYARIQIKSDAHECLEIRHPSQGMGLGLECVHEKERAIPYGEIHRSISRPDRSNFSRIRKLNLRGIVNLKVKKNVNLNSRQGIRETGLYRKI